MSCYISSNDNRFYVALESTYGNVPAITAQNRIPALKLTTKQVLELTKRRDKTGGRTFVGLPNTIRKKTNYTLGTLMTEWTNQTLQPSQAPLFQAAMGGTPVAYNGGTVSAVTGLTEIQFAAPHGLDVGQGVTSGNEMRFVTTIVDPQTLFINAAFSTPLQLGSTLGTTLSFPLAESLPSVSIFDYWDPSGAVQRILNGAAIDTMTVKVNGDYQEFDFAGPSQDLLDSASFTSGQGGLTAFPSEPAPAGFDYTVIPGHVGEVWMGATPNQFFTLTEAQLTLNNNVDLRAQEFGSDLARCIAAGVRSVTLNFSIFEMADAQTAALYQAARERIPIQVMFQLGQQPGQLFGFYMPAMIPEVPEYDDSETRLQWKFQNDRAQGTVNDELYVAFG